jgi:hypothetical protein
LVTELIPNHNWILWKFKWYSAKNSDQYHRQCIPRRRGGERGEGREGEGREGERRRERKRGEQKGRGRRGERRRGKVKGILWKSKWNNAKNSDQYCRQCIIKEDQQNGRRRGEKVR